MGRAAGLIALAVVGCIPPEDKKPPAPIESAGQSGSEDTGDDCPAGGCVACELPHEPCAGDDEDLFLAMGLCPDREIDPARVAYSGAPEARRIMTAVGQGDTYGAREGDSYLLMSTGNIDTMLTQEQCHVWYAEDQYKGEVLPAPIQIDGVSNVEDCIDNPGLVGTGDCSNSIAGQFFQGEFAHDYAEVRVGATVPQEATAVKFDFAFLSTEYPEYWGSLFNDMFIVWLESETWTGNVSFDEFSQPISLNASFLHFKDDAATLPQFAGTCLAGHAGTRWITTQAAVTPGEDVEMVFAIFDLGDGMFDSFVLIDEFRWGCDDTTGPETLPDTTGPPEP